MSRLASPHVRSRASDDEGRVDLGLRIEGVDPGGRLHPSRIHETMPVQIPLSTLTDVDDEVVTCLRRAYSENS